jgi:hypothetical protein
MKSPRLVLAAAAAATLLSAPAVFAAPPTADQVTVSGGHQGRYEAKMHALFSSPEDRMMFKADMRKATHGMTHAQKRAYKKQQMQRIRAMSDSEKAAWRQGLKAKWDAMPAESRTRLAEKIERHAEKHQQRGRKQDRDQGRDQDQGEDMSAPPQ